MKALAHGSLRMRGWFVRLVPPRRKPNYLRSTHRIRSYPGEFMIDKLGTFSSSPPFRGTEDEGLIPSGPGTSSPHRRSGPTSFVRRVGRFGGGGALNEK